MAGIKMDRTAVAWAAAAAPLLLALTACTAQRPAHLVKESADRERTLGHYEVAAREYTEVVERYGGDWEAQYGLGLCHLELGQYPQARRALETAASLEPQRGEITEALAQTMLRQGDHNRLYGYLREKAEADQSVDSYLRLARYSTAIGDADSAKRAVERAIDLDDGQVVEPYLEAAELAESLGDLELAVRRLRQAYAIDPHNGAVKQRLLAMGEIPGPTIALPPGR